MGRFGRGNGGGTFSTGNHDGASAAQEGRPSNISEKDYRALQERARKASPELDNMFSDESVRRARLGTASYHAAERGEN